ncbi:MAG: radical SAM protein [Clostridia bacterium]|nr:radical SAM protein [Clostridia bacterium]
MRKFNIPVFVPHKGCPYDCVFCNQKRITGNLKETTPDDVTRIIEEHLKTLPSVDRTIEVAFFGGSFTGIPIEEQSALMERVKPYIESGEVYGIRLSTRPDYINDEILQNLKKYGVTTIELGVQSMVDTVLKTSNRGHTSEDVAKAVELIHSYGFSLGLQMMTGLPGDTPEYSIETAKRIIALKPDFVRIYPTLTIKDTYLEKMYHKGEYQPQTLEDAVDLAKELLLMFEESGIGVIRIGLQPTDEINANASVVAGPFHSSFGELVESAVYYDIIENAVKGLSGDVTIYVNPKEVSKATGNKRKNIIRIKNNTGINIKIATDDNLKRREVRYTCF